MNYGFLRVATACPKVHLADVKSNVSEIIATADHLSSQGAEIIVFPELCLTGYTCADLFHSAVLINAVKQGIAILQEESRRKDWIILVGAPIEANQKLYNCAAIIVAGHVNYVAKAHLPNYNEFYEARYFTALPIGEKVQTSELEINDASTVFTIHAGEKNVKLGVELCEDLWVPESPSVSAAMNGAEVICNLSASPDTIGKYEYLRDLVRIQSGKLLCAYIYSSAGWGESSTDLVYTHKGIITECGKLLWENKRFSIQSEAAIADIDLDAIRHDRMHTTTFKINNPAEIHVISQPGFKDSTDLIRYIDPHPFVPSNADERTSRCTEIINIQAMGLARRLDAIRCKSAVIGISGGLDSTLALLVTVKAFDILSLDRKGILAVTMPGFGTTHRTHDNATELMQKLGITRREISIVPAVNQHFKDIGHDATVQDVTYENSQARERTQLLMDLANQCNGIVVGTGDLSELALGWATYNGDHMSMYGVNVGVPKTLVSYLVQWFAQENPELSHVLNDIIATPISPELVPGKADDIAQRTEDLVGPYELHDFFLYYVLRYGFMPEKIFFLARMAFKGKYEAEIIEKWLRNFYRRFFAQQFKRSCMPDGPKVGSVCLSPRGDWRMPSDASSAAWLNDL